MRRLPDPEPDPDLDEALVAVDEKDGSAWVSMSAWGRLSDRVEAIEEMWPVRAWRWLARSLRG